MNSNKKLYKKNDLKKVIIEKKTKNLLLALQMAVLTCFIKDICHFYLKVGQCVIT